MQERNAGDDFLDDQRRVSQRDPRAKKLHLLLVDMRSFFKLEKIDNKSKHLAAALSVSDGLDGGGGSLPEEHDSCLPGASSFVRSDRDDITISLP